jgi:hypothetical protein
MKKNIVLLAVFALVFALPSAAQAVSIGLNFQDGDGFETMVAADSAGVIPQINWNQSSDFSANNSQSGTIDNMINDAGLASGVKVEWTSANAWRNENSTAASTADTKMMDGYAEINGSQYTFDFTGISYAEYDIYVYVGDDGRGSTATVSNGTTSFSFSTNSDGAIFPGAYLQTTDTGAGNPLANYAVFSGLSGASQSFNFPTKSAQPGIHGFQIVDTTIPEPSSMALLLTGACALLLRRRRRREARTATHH